MRRLAVLRIALALLAAPACVAAQDVHAGASGWVFETAVLERTRDGRIRLANGAAMLATPDLSAVRAGGSALLVPLRSGCRIWTESSGLARCTLVGEVPDDASRTEAVLVWVERVIDAGATVLLAGGSVLEAAPSQRELTRGWSSGEAVLIGGARLLHLEHGAEPVVVRRVR